MAQDGARTSRRALHAVAFGAAGIAVAYASAFAPPAIAAVGPWVMAIAMPLVMLAVMVLGAVRGGQPLGVLRAPLLGVGVLVMGSFVLALALPPDAPGAPLWLGLPRRAAIILYGVGVLPLFVLPIAYAVSFDAHTLTADAVARVRATRRNPHADS